jgi:conjugal transfer pilus assembly protein TraE
MHIKAYIDDYENLKVENKLIKFTIVVIGLSSIVSAFLVYNALKYQKTIILPPVVDRKIVVSGNDANDDYFKLYSKYIMGLLLNYTPPIFADQSKDLLSICTPSFYPSMEKRLKEIGRGIEKLNITSTFYPYRIKIDRKKALISVEGKREQTARGQLIESAKQTYLITYLIINGRLQINDIAEKIKK